MRLLTDENVAASVIRSLKNEGHNVFDIKGAGWRSAPDTKLVRYAIRTRRVIITHDKDFLRLAGVAVVVLRFARQNPALVAPALIHFLDSPQGKKIKKNVRVILAEHYIEIYRGV